MSRSSFKANIYHWDTIYWHLHRTKNNIAIQFKGRQHYHVVILTGPHFDLHVHVNDLTVVNNLTCKWSHTHIQLWMISHSRITVTCEWSHRKHRDFIFYLLNFLCFESKPSEDSLLVCLALYALDFHYSSQHPLEKVNKKGVNVLSVYTPKNSMGHI